MAKKVTAKKAEKAAPVKKLDSWQKRVVAEQAELDKKVKSLAVFMGADTFKDLQPDAKEDLTDQLGFMKRYSAVLTKRIEKFA